jgi:hypothetical protein
MSVLQQPVLQPELPLDVSVIQQPVVPLDMSFLQQPAQSLLPLDVSFLQQPLLPLDMSVLHQPVLQQELPLDVFVIQPLDVSAQQTVGIRDSGYKPKKTTETDRVSVLFGSYQNHFLFVSRTPYPE